MATNHRAQRLQHAFDYYAQNLTLKTKVGNNDQKADKYWYWFLSVATQRDLTPFFNANKSWAYGVTDNFHGLDFVPALGLDRWEGPGQQQPPPRPCPPLPAYELC